MIADELREFARAAGRQTDTPAARRLAGLADQVDALEQLADRTELRRDALAHAARLVLPEPADRAEHAAASTMRAAGVLLAWLTGAGQEPGHD